MTDFLTRMARLSRGETSLVSPRIPGLFGPTVQAESAVTDDTSAAVSINDPNAVQSHNSTETRTSRVHATTAAVHTAHTEPAAVSHPDRNADKDRPPLQPTRQAPQVGDVSAPTADNIQADAGIAPAAVAAHESGSAGETILPVSTEASQAVSPASRVMPVEPAVDRNRHGDDSMAPPPSPLVTDYPHQQASAQEVMAQRAPSQEAPSANEPVVHINIGRIEVRARTSGSKPAPQPVGPSRDKGLSLNDYLKRGGGRS